MKSSEFRRTVNLPDVRRRKILDAVGSLPGAIGAPQFEHDGPPAHPRDFDIGIAITQSDGPTTHFVVSARSISLHGLCILHSGFLHTGTRCALFSLRGPDPAPLATGDVRWVHHVDGGIHAIGIRFDTPFDTGALVSSDSTRRRADPSAKPAALSDIRGRVLVIDARKADAEATRKQLQAVGLDVAVASDTASALAAMAPAPPDAIVSDLDLDAGMTIESAIKLFGRRGFTGPVVILTASTDQARIEAIHAANTHSVVRKPCERKALLVAVTTALVRAGAIKAKRAAPTLQSPSAPAATPAAPGATVAPSLRPLRSTLKWSADCDHLVTMYIEEARTMAQSLIAAMEVNDRNSVRRTCISLRGAAADYGFEPLAEAASLAIEAVSKNADAGLLASRIADIRTLASRLAPSNRAA